MVGLSDIVAVSRVLPVVKNDIGRRWDVSIIFHPAPELLIETHHARAAALGRHDVAQATLEGDRGHERRAPRPRGEHPRASGKRALGVVDVQHLLMLGAVLARPQPRESGGHDFLSKFFFCHYVTSVIGV